MHISEFCLFFVVLIVLLIFMQVPGVEADDVIGTLALKSVEEGYKVLCASLNC